MEPFDPEVYNDDKIKTVLDMLTQGKTKKEIANYYGHGWSGVDQYFRRKGFRWSGETFVPKEDLVQTNDATKDAQLLTTKAGHIIRMLSQKHANIKQIANKNGFTTVDEMGLYMKGQGYTWSHELCNYEYDENLVQKRSSSTIHPKIIGSLSIPNGLDEYHNLLQYLLSKKDRLFLLLETESDGTLPRYKFKGAKANKTLGLPTSLQTLLMDFSKEFNVTQRDIIEVALAEFFKKYGYEEQLNSVLLA